MMYQTKWQNEVETFEEQGVIIVRNLLPSAIVKECADALTQFTRFEKAKEDGNAIFDQDDQSEYLKYFQHINFYIPTFWKLIDSAVLNLASALLKQEVYCFGMGLHDKAPGKGTLTPHHQDNYYWCLDPADAMTAYISLDQQSSDNGGITYFPKTHRLGTLNHVFSKTTAFSSGLENFNPDEWEPIRPSLSPGDVAFHHGNIVHCAEANHSDRSRRAIAMILYGREAMLSKTMNEEYAKNLRQNRDNKISATIRVSS